jgi:hypothetical protein
MAGKLQCERHQAEAGWQCTVCDRLLCPDCAATKLMHPITVVACTYCGELAQPVTAEQTHADALWPHVPGAFGFAFTTQGLPLWLGLVVLDALLISSGFGGVAVRLLGLGLVLGGLFNLIRATSSGMDSALEFVDVATSVAMPLVRFAVVLAPFWGGALAAVLLHRPALAIVSGVVGLFWVPVAIIGAAAGASLLDLMNPLRVVGVAVRLGADFAVYAGGLLVAFGALVVGALLAVVVATVSIVAAVLVLSVTKVYALVSAARLAGLVLRTHGELFGHDTSRRPTRVGGALPEPRGVLPEVSMSSATANRHAPIELEPEPEVAPQPRSRFEALEVSPDAPVPTEAAHLDLALLPDHSEQSALEIRQAVAAKNVDLALDAFRATGLSAAEQLSPDELMWVGQAAAVRLDNESAELAFSKVSGRRDAAPAVRARSKVMLARLLAERLGRKAEAKVLMEAVVAEFPNEAAAGFARTWLSRG